MLWSPPFLFWTNKTLLRLYYIGIILAIFILNCSKKLFLYDLTALFVKFIWWCEYFFITLHS